MPFAMNYANFHELNLLHKFIRRKVYMANTGLQTQQDVLTDEENLVTAESPDRRLGVRLPVILSMVLLPCRIIYMH